MIIKTNLSKITSAIQQSNSSGNVFAGNSGDILLGKVYGVITTPNTPNKNLYELNGGSSNIGLVFYKPYKAQEVKDQDDKTDLETCDIALPLFPNVADYPLINEIVYLIPGPSPDNQRYDGKPQMYYVCPINQWDNAQENAPSGERLGTTFKESTNINRLLSFEGDRIYQGRKGNGIRFGSTVKYHADLNEWSSGPSQDGDPITILTNGYTPDSSSLISEKINKEQSSIWMTSTQRVLLTPDRSTNINPITLPIVPSSYFSGSQIILNSDRITLNSKKDEVMIFAGSNVEISTNNIINLNSNLHTHINSPIIFLGTKNNNPPDEPVLLGRQTIALLNEMMNKLCQLGINLASTVSPPPGSPIMEINAVGNELVNEITKIQKKLNTLLSKTTFTS
jgi:hypothetical protein